MPEDPPKPEPPDELPPDSPAGADSRDRERDRERDRGLSDFVRRAVAAGFEAAGRSKEDIVRIATGEIRDWLDRLELDTELRKALSGMVLEVKAEIRFRPPRARRWPPRPRVTSTFDATRANASRDDPKTAIFRLAPARVLGIVHAHVDRDVFDQTERTLPLGSGFAGRSDVAPGSRRWPGGHHPHLPGLGGRR
jgi:hypothetical protein